MKFYIISEYSPGPGILLLFESLRSLNSTSLLVGGID